MWRSSITARSLSLALALALVFPRPTLAVDAAAPALISFTSSSASGTYRAGHTIGIAANFSEKISSTSTVTVRLDTGASVVLGNVSSSTVSGRYVVGKGEESDDLEVVAITSASVRDLAGNLYVTGSLPSTNISAGSSIKVRGSGGDSSTGGGSSSGAGSSGGSSSSSGSNSDDGNEGEDDGGDTITSVGAIAAVAGVAAVIAADSASAAARFDQPFGGYIVTSLTCENGPLYLLVYDFRSFVTLPLLLQPWSRLNEYFAPSYGNAVLGTYLPIPGECVLSYYPYVALTTIGEISPYPYAGVGTSLLPL